MTIIDGKKKEFVAHCIDLILEDFEKKLEVYQVIIAQGRRITSCIAHCIDLILEDFEKKIEVYQVIIAKGRRITSYIYSRTIFRPRLFAEK